MCLSLGSQALPGLTCWHLGLQVLPGLTCWRLGSLAGRANLGNLGVGCGRGGGGQFGASFNWTPLVVNLAGDLLLALAVPPRGNVLVSPATPLPPMGGALNNSAKLMGAAGLGCLFVHF